MSRLVSQASLHVEATPPEQFHLPGNVLARTRFQRRWLLGYLPGYLANWLPTELATYLATYLLS